MIRMSTLERFFHKNDKGVEDLTVLIMDKNCEVGMTTFH